MSSTWITLNPRLEAGVALLNALDPIKLPSLLNRIIVVMQRDVTEANASPMFSNDEEVKLEKSLGLDLKDVHLIIDLLLFILQQSAFHKTKPELLQSKLLDGLHLNEEKAAVIVEVWSLNAGTIIENLRHKSVLPQQLADVSWMLMVETSSDVVRQKKEPVALLELSLKSYLAEKDPKIQLKMHQTELLELYQKLEHVQSQLDSLK